MNFIKAISGNAQAQEKFVDKNINKIMFVVSVLAQTILSPLSTILGIAAGFTYSCKMKSAQKVKANEKIITPAIAVFALVGAFASFIKCTPAGAMGGFVFHLVPYASAFSIGSTFHSVLCSQLNF